MFQEKFASPGVGSLKSLGEIASGKALIVNYWATWCPSCIEELPSLEFLHRSLRLSGKVRIITISVDDDDTTLIKFINQLSFKMSLPIFWDKQGRVARRFQIEKFPETHLYGQDGTLLWKWVGPYDWTSEGIAFKIEEFIK